MKRHRVGSHTPEEMRRLSDLGHRVEGGLLGSVGLLALLQQAGIAPWAAAVAWPALLLVAGALLLAIIYPTHPREDWPAIWRDPQQREHTIMAAAIVIAGAAELSRGKAAWLGYVWPLAMLLIGWSFLTHAQHGTGEAVARATFLHRVLGITLVAAGLLRAAELATGAAALGFLWPIALLAAAAQLLLYHEPAGAFEAAGSHATHR